VENITIIGGGIGGAIAHDLTQRGYHVTLFEKGALLSGSTGRHHGLLHSGARYVLHDPETAKECWMENQILRDIAPEGLEQNGGLFIALNDEDMAHRDAFIENCRLAGIPVRKVPKTHIRLIEPELHPRVIAAFEVPDAVMDAWRLALHFFATARLGGADIRPFSEVTAVLNNGEQAIGVEVLDHRTHRTYTHEADIVLNAAGPWAGKVAALLDIDLPVKPAPGVMVSVGSRLAQRVINRLHPAGEGDIIVPQRNLSLLGTTVWLADDPDGVTLPPGHVEHILEACSHMIPGIRQAPIHAVWHASRPLIVRHRNQDPTKISRTFDCIDHAVEDGIEGFVSILGGKATTMRAMAERTGDLINAKTGRRIPCRTHAAKLAHYRKFYGDSGNLR
jgi:glycerol-3-phosphate dehydrogenase